jgi:hypothetical protein
VVGITINSLQQPSQTRWRQRQLLAGWLNDLCS